MKPLATDGWEKSSPNYQDQSAWTNGVSQLVDLLDSLRMEIADILNKRELGRTEHDPGLSYIRFNQVGRSAQPEKDPRKKTIENGQLNEQAQHLEEFQPTHAGSKMTRSASDIVINDDAQESRDPEKIQEEIFNMIMEISQEKREHELKLRKPILVRHVKP